VNIRRIVGAGLVAVGVANIANFYSPSPVPTVGLGAFVVGAAFIVSGLSVAGVRLGVGERLRALFRSGIARSDAAPRLQDPMLPVRALKLAERRRGRLTVSVVAMELETGLDQAQAALEELERRGAAASEVDEATGLMTWRFPEFLPPAT
jgi:hypothetical protein